MKKRRLNILWIMAALFAFTGCNDFLDIQPVGKVMPKTAKEYRALLTDAYSRIPAERNQYDQFRLLSGYLEMERH